MVNNLGPLWCSVRVVDGMPRAAYFFFGVRILLGTILGRFSIIYFRGLGLRVRIISFHFISFITKSVQ